MNKLQELQLKASEIRSKLAETEDAEAQDKLVKEYGAVEREIRVQMVKDDEPAKEPQKPVEDYEEVDEDGEEREYRQLLAKATISEYFSAVANGRAVTGAEAEIQKHCGIASHTIPLDVLFGREERQREERAVTPPPSSNTALNQQAIEQHPLPQSVSAFLGIPMPRVAAGTPAYPAMTNNASVKGPYTDSTSVDETTGAFAVVTVPPARYQASFFYRRVDTALFPGMDAALRQNLNRALADQYDKEVLQTLAKDTTITKGTKIAANSARSAYLSAFVYDRVDGIWAKGPMDVKGVVGITPYRQLAAKYGSSTSQAFDGTAWERINAQSGGYRVSANLPAIASKAQVQVIRLGMARDAVFPMWEGVTLINDEVTKAKTGEIVITAVSLAAFKLLRKEGFYLAEYATAA